MEQETHLPPQTEWKVYSFYELKTMAEDDDYNVEDIDDLMTYLEQRADNYVKYLGNDLFDVLFA